MMAAKMELYLYGRGVFEAEDLTQLRLKAEALQEQIQEAAKELGFELQFGCGSLMLDGAEVIETKAGNVNLPEEPPIDEKLLGELEGIYRQLELDKRFNDRRDWVLAHLGLFRQVTVRQYEVLDVYYLRSGPVPTGQDASSALGYEGGGQSVRGMLAAAFSRAQARLEDRLYEWSHSLSKAELMQQPILILGSFSSTSAARFRRQHPDIKTIGDLYQWAIHNRSELESIQDEIEITRFANLLEDHGVSLGIED
jgi:hypothetical protein